MFGDIGFMEIMVVLIIGLLVIGPERMPEVARKIGQFIGKTRRFIDSVKQDGEFKQAVDELKEAVDFEEQKKELQNLGQDLQQDLQSTAHDIEPLDFDELQRPFGQSNETAEPSAFRKAPAMPEPPKPQSNPQSGAPNGDGMTASNVDTSQQPQATSAPASSESVQQSNPQQPEQANTQVQTASTTPEKTPAS